MAAKVAKTHRSELIRTGALAETFRLLIERGIDVNAPMLALHRSGVDMTKVRERLVRFYKNEPDTPAQTGD